MTLVGAFSVIVQLRQLIVYSTNDDLSLWMGAMPKCVHSPLKSIADKDINYLGELKQIWCR